MTAIRGTEPLHPAPLLNSVVRRLELQNGRANLDRKVIFMIWRKIVFNRSQVAAGAQLKLITKASDILNRAGAPADAAVFTSSLPNAAGELSVFFSPAAAELVARLLGVAASCEAPDSQSVSLSVGKPGTAWQLLRQ